MTTRVLIVDDHAMMRDGLRALLEREASVEVVGEADSGRGALRRVRELRPDIVIMDIGMKDLNGVEATQQIRDAYPSTQVIGLSTYLERRTVLEMLEAGACAYIPKISAHEELVTAIEAVSEGKSFLSPKITQTVLDAARQAAMALPRSARAVLSAREREVLQLVAEGLTSGEIAERMHLSVRTVETHRANIMHKLGIHTIAELTKYAIREGLTPVEA